MYAKGGCVRVVAHVDGGAEPAREAIRDRQLIPAEVRGFAHDTGVVNDSRLPTPIPRILTDALLNSVSHS